jgi:SAM-dependent MidA family methyltransferase
MSAGPGSVSTPPPALQAALRAAIEAEGGWLPFDRYMAIVLYEPGLGYYSRDDRQIGRLARDGSDFVTAPEMSPLFGRALAVQIAQALDATGTDEVWEFGAGRGTLASQLLDALGGRVRGYHIVELSGALAARQRATLGAAAPRVRWHATLPAQLSGVVVGNEVLDAMPVRLLVRAGDGWRERGVVLDAGGAYAWADRPTDAVPPLDPGTDAAAFAPGALTEIHPQAVAFVRTIAAALTRGAAFFIDYGFPAAEYHHPQRSGGTLMCHRAHRADPDPLADVGAKDITAHVDFSAIALAGEDAGLDVLGYTSQARFLLNCGIAALIEAAPLVERVAAQRLLHEHEMGELFKVIGFVAGAPFDALGFAAGDRTHRL